MIKIYLAIPYSGMEESSFEQANEATVKLLKQGFNVFSPITHSHPLTRFDLPGTWEFWSKIDYQFLDWCDLCLVLVPKEGEEKVNASVGVKAEIDYAIKKKKLVLFGEMLELDRIIPNLINELNHVE
jgi:nucleoside 2-deoxyribosyltransferase